MEKIENLFLGGSLAIDEILNKVLYSFFIGIGLLGKAMQVAYVFAVVLLIFLGIVLLMGKWRKPSEGKLKRQQEEYEQLLKKYQVPKEHYRIVIGQSRVYSVYNCPAIIWKEGNKVKTLVMRLHPIVFEQDEEEYLFLSAQPLLDFKRFDGSTFPDWAIQSDYVKQEFLPFVNMNKTVGGLDYDKQMYWIGTICVYPASLPQILTLLGRPLSDYENRVEKKELMLKDGSLPKEMEKELLEKIGKKDHSAKQTEGRKQEIQEMEKAIQQIRYAERKAGEEAAEDRINRLYARLLSEKRYADLERAIQDTEYRESLFEQ